MILIRHTHRGLRRLVDLTDIYRGRGAILVGGAPSLKEQPIELLEQRGLLTMAMNNAAQHFRPTMWSSSDHPDCYQPKILMDPTIMKFGSVAHADKKIEKLDVKFKNLTNTYFYINEPNVPWDEYLSSRKGVPWYNNTLLVSIHMLYQMGIRTIVLAGSDFGFTDDKVYAHDTKLDDLQIKWNRDLYNSLVKELRMLKPIFDQAGLEFYDCSKNSRVGQVYRHISMEEAVDICLDKYPAEWADSKDLPHCSKFASKKIQDRIAQWPGYQAMDGQPDGEKEELEVQQVI